MRTNNYAFIDSQNVNLSIREQGWKLDFARFRKYLEDKYSVTKAFLFVGYIATYQSLYTALQKDGFILIFKPTLPLPSGKPKGNVDAELVLHTMIELPTFEKAVIVSGDGDFYCLIDYLRGKTKLLKVMIPNRNSYSSLHKKVHAEHRLHEQPEGETGAQVGQKKREALPRDETLWMASHRDSSYKYTTNYDHCQHLSWKASLPSVFFHGVRAGNSLVWGTRS